MARVVALLPDLLFGSKLAAALQQAGHEVVSCLQAQDARAQAGGADVLIVDLTGGDDPDGVELVGSMRAVGALHDTPTLAFYLHTDTDTRARAEGAGIDLVVPRSRMAREGPELVAGLLESRS